MNEETGAIGWWVSPENQKAKLIQPYEPREDSASGWSELAKSHAVPDVGEFGFDTYLSDPEAFVPDPDDTKPIAKVVTRNTMSFLGSTNPTSPHVSFHDYSSSSVGLLTNVATGGWKKDLTLLSESWDDIYTKYSGAALPLFRYAPVAGSVSAVPKPSVNNYEPDQVGIYPWSGFLQIGGATWWWVFYQQSLTRLVC